MTNAEACADIRRRFAREIREAVEAERDECAAIADRVAKESSAWADALVSRGLPAPNTEGATGAAIDVAERIRARGAK